MAFQRSCLSIALTGESKGKTTSSVALALNEILKGNKVLFLQFLKGGKFSGEVIYLTKNFSNSIKVLQFGKFSIYAEQIAEGKKAPGIECFVEVEGYKKSLKKYSIEKTIELINSKEFNVLILDEALTAYWLKKLSSKQIKMFKEEAQRNNFINFVCTGRLLDNKIIKLFDKVYEYKMIKHPFHDINLVGRYGIEY
ncbi:MAG: cob(I)yrinic acid a,c-diamide adenosyltransferase [Candidatus Anstonellales archaeon]